MGPNEDDYADNVSHNDEAPYEEGPRDTNSEDEGGSPPAKYYGIHNLTHFKQATANRIDDIAARIILDEHAETFDKIAALAEALSEYPASMWKYSRGLLSKLRRAISGDDFAEHPCTEATANKERTLVAIAAMLLLYHYTISLTSIPIEAATDEYSTAQDMIKLTDSSHKIAASLRTSARIAGESMANNRRTSASSLPDTALHGKNTRPPPQAVMAALDRLAHSDPPSSHSTTRPPRPSLQVLAARPHSHNDPSGTPDEDLEAALRSPASAPSSGPHGPAPAMLTHSGLPPGVHSQPHISTEISIESLALVSPVTPLDCSAPILSSGPHGPVPAMIPHSGPLSKKKNLPAGESMHIGKGRVTPHISTETAPVHGSDVVISGTESMHGPRREAGGGSTSVETTKATMGPEICVHRMPPTDPGKLSNAKLRRLTSKQRQEYEAQLKAREEFKLQWLDAGNSGTSGGSGLLSCWSAPAGASEDLDSMVTAKGTMNDDVYVDSVLGGLSGTPRLATEHCSPGE
jgi:hypothetical protein